MCEARKVRFRLGRMLVEKLQMLQVAMAPYTDQKVQPHAQTHAQRQRTLQPFRRQPGHRRAIRRMLPDPGDPTKLEGFQRLHWTCPSLPNQFVSRQLRSAIRARCNITHRLPSEMFSIAQISLLSTPSTSRRLKSVATFF